MKRVLVCSLLAVLLGGCVVAPYGYRDDEGYRHHDGYSGSGYDGYRHHDGYSGSGYDGFRHYDHG